MADNFFGFNTNFPSGKVLGKKALDDEFLTNDVEEEYDALNDETFGQAANDDWEEAHEKLSELVIEKNDHRGNSVFDDSLLENDESQDEIVSKSISQLGLEDDLDDPAIMTVARNCSGRFRSFRSSSSPPPPAILETEDCGSPKTYSIWSRTPKDSGVSSLLKSLGHGSSGLVENDSLKSSTDNVFITPPKAWRAEELEKNLLSAANEHNTGETWPQVSPIMKVNQNLSNKLTSQLPNNLGQNQNKIAMDKMLTREEVERRMHSDARHHYPANVPNYVPPHLVPGLHPAMMSPIGAPRINNLGVPNHSSPNLQMNPLRPPLLGNNCRMPDRYFVNTRMNMMLNQLPLRGPAMPNLPPGFNPSNMNLNHAKLLSLPPRSIAHPLLHKQFQFPPLVYNNVYNNYYENDDMEDSAYNVEDEYAGLMTQREKEWLIRIQLLQLKSENPHVEDYYFTTQVARRCQKKYSESANKGGGDAPELILPETTKHENRAFVPVQFEGSLGKLQAVSVNFPRKVLDITVTRPLEDDEGKVVTNQSLMRYRRLLLDIEMFYRYLLEIEDEERRILAKPETEGGQHRENIAKMKSEIFSGLFNETSSEDYFQNVMTIRKGRSLVMRVFKIFNTEQQLSCLIHLFRCLSVILKKDQHDLILVQHTAMITDSIGLFSLPDLVQLGEALENTASDVKGKDKNNLVAALKNKFGVSVICSLVTRAEDLYGGFDLFDSDIQSRWAAIVVHVVECICTLQSSSVTAAVASCSNLLSHFQRFAVDRDKFGLLQEKLALLETNSKAGIKAV